MVMRMAWRVQSPDRGTFHLEHLAIYYGLLELARRVLVDTRSEVWIQANEIGNTPGVVSMPVGEKNMGQREIPRQQGAGD